MRRGAEKEACMGRWEWQTGHYSAIDTGDDDGFPK